MSLEPNNIDNALTPEPKHDPWADDSDELTEDTGQAHQIGWGRTVDAYFAAAHAAGAALRKLRRPKKVPAVVEQERKSHPPRIGMCVECGHHVKVDGWHAPCGRNTVVDPLPDDAHDDYHDRLRAAVERISGRQRQRRPDVPDMWRALSGYGNYIMHSRTREVWRQAYDRTLSNGGIRHYPARRCTLTNGAYSLTVDGVTSSRGVNALWNDTFPEFAHCKGTKKKVGEWAGEIEFRRNELGDYRGLAEWLSDGGASIVTRPH